MKTKSLLTVLLAMVACGMTVDLIVFETGWVIPSEEEKRQINVEEVC